MIVQLPFPPFSLTASSSLNGLEQDHRMTSLVSTVKNNITNNLVFKAYNIYGILKPLRDSSKKHYSSSEALLIAFHRLIS